MSKINKLTNEEITFIIDCLFAHLDQTQKKHNDMNTLNITEREISNLQYKIETIEEKLLDINNEGCLLRHITKAT